MFDSQRIPYWAHEVAKPTKQPLRTKSTLVGIHTSPKRRKWRFANERVGCLPTAHDEGPNAIGTNIDAFVKTQNRSKKGDCSIITEDLILFWQGEVLISSSVVPHRARSMSSAILCRTCSWVRTE